MISCPSIESSFAAWKDITPRESWGVKDLGRRIVERAEQEYAGQVYVVASLLNLLQLTAIRNNAGFNGVYPTLLTLIMPLAQNFARLSKMTSFTSMENPLSGSPISRQRSFQRQSVDSTVGTFYIYFVLSAIRVRLLATRFSAWKHAASTTRLTSKQLEILKMQLMESKYVASTQLQKIASLEEKLTSRQQERIEGEVAALRARDDIRLALEQAAARADAAEEELCRVLDAKEELAHLTAPTGLTKAYQPATVHFFVASLRRIRNIRLKRRFDAWKWETYMHYTEILNNTRLREIEVQQQENIQRAVLEHSNSLPPPPPLAPQCPETKVSLHLLVSVLRAYWLQRLRRRFDAWKWETYVYYAEAANHQRLHEMNVLVRRESMRAEETLLETIEKINQDHGATPPGYYRFAVTLQHWATHALRHRWQIWKRNIIEAHHVLDCSEQFIDSTTQNDNLCDAYHLPTDSCSEDNHTELQSMLYSHQKSSICYLKSVVKRSFRRIMRRHFDVWKWNLWTFRMQSPKEIHVQCTRDRSRLVTTTIAAAEHLPHGLIFVVACSIRDAALQKLKYVFEVWKWNTLFVELEHVEVEHKFNTQSSSIKPSSTETPDNVVECITYADGSVEYITIPAAQPSVNNTPVSQIPDSLTFEQNAFPQRQDQSANATEDVIPQYSDVSTDEYANVVALLEASVQSLQQQLEASTFQIEHYRNYIDYVMNKITPIITNQPTGNNPINVKRMSKFPKTVLKKLHDRVGDKSFHYDRKIAFSSALQVVESEERHIETREDIPWTPPPPPPAVVMEKHDDIMVVNPAIEAAMSAVVSPQKSRRKSQSTEIARSTINMINPPVHAGASGDSSEYLDYICATAKSFDSGSEGQGSNVRVAIRMRPMNSREESVSMQAAVEMTDTNNLTIVDVDTTQEHNYCFDYCFDAAVTERTANTCGIQEVVFEKLGIEILANAWKGYNTSIFACMKKYFVQHFEFIVL